MEPYEQREKRLRQNSFKPFGRKRGPTTKSVGRFETRIWDIMRKYLKSAFGESWLRKFSCAPYGYNTGLMDVFVKESDVQHVRDRLDTLYRLCVNKDLV